MTLIAMGVTLLFAAFTALVLERAFRDNAEAAAATRLEAQILLLMGVADVTGPREIQFPATLPEPRLQLPGSGLYARVLSVGGAEPPRVLWRSPSAIGVELSDWRERRFVQHSRTVDWDAGGERFPLTFQLLEDRSLLDEQLESYRRQLWVLLGGMTLFLLVSLIWALIRWGLKPLRRVRTDLDQLRAGQELRMRGVYPGEVQDLTDSINTLLEFSARRLERQRNALADLAHSLKTPLAAIRLDLEATPPRVGEAREQAERMLSIVQYQLGQATRETPLPFQAAVPIAEPVARTVAALDRVAATRGVRLEMQLDEHARLRIEPGAIFELLGNVLDNAMRYAEARIRVTLVTWPDQVELSIEDDGPGFPDDACEQLQARGQRLDEGGTGAMMAGGNQGLGLDIVRQLVEDYGGTLVIDRSKDLNGAHVKFCFPVD